MKCNKDLDCKERVLAESTCPIHPILLRVCHTLVGPALFLCHQSLWHRRKHGMSVETWWLEMLPFQYQHSKGLPLLLLFTCTLQVFSTPFTCLPSKFVISSISFSIDGFTIANFTSWTWLTAYLVEPRTILMTFAALRLPCRSNGERDHYNFPFLEGNVSAGGWETTGGSTRRIILLIRGECRIISVLLNIILCVRHILLYVTFNVKELWQNLISRKPLLRGHFLLRESIKKWFRRLLCKLLYVCSSSTLCELSVVLTLLHVMVMLGP